MFRARHLARGGSLGERSVLSSAPARSRLPVHRLPLACPCALRCVRVHEDQVKDEWWGQGLCLTTLDPTLELWAGAWVTRELCSKKAHAWVQRPRGQTEGFVT